MSYMHTCDRGNVVDSKRRHAIIHCELDNKEHTMHNYRVTYKYIDCVVRAKNKTEAKAEAARLYTLMPSKARGITCERIN